MAGWISVFMRKQDNNKGNSFISGVDSGFEKGKEK